MPSPAKTGLRCTHCGERSPLISQALGLCWRCLKSPRALPHIEEAHTKARSPFALPARVPKGEGGRLCRLCANECRIPQGGRSFCGLRLGQGERLSGTSVRKGNLLWYHDPLPTNCVADWVCPGGTGAGYPCFAYRRGPEFGYKNLAVFYRACSFDCLFCQNWHYRLHATREGDVTPQKLALKVDRDTACLCYFGGDPTPQLPHALLASRLALERAKGRILRICWETNGSMHPSLLKKMAQLSLASGGCIKVDLKAWDEGLHLALCGVSNRRTLENFRLLAGYTKERPSPPLLVASTLLVPGYVGKEEVSRIAAFIASLDRDIPYSLLAFHPQFFMTDLPTTSRRHAQESLGAAEAQGLRRVRIGNLHLLGDDY